MLTDLVRKESTAAERARFAEDVRTGLSASPKHLSSQYFYDAVGMRLFQEIMELPEYYLTRCEHRILTDSREAIRAALAATALNILDLGSGDASKTKILLDHFPEHGTAVRYFPVDISHDTLNELIANLANTMPSLPVHAVAAEYFEALQWIREHQEGHKLVLFLGSNIGNFTLARARIFLQQLHDVLDNGDYVLIGFDLKKDPRVIQRAYDDGAGVTARFNLNLLTRMNRELDADFDLSAFQHYAFYDQDDGAAKSFLVSTRTQQIHIGTLNATFAFEAWESIHTEDSRKYSPHQIGELASASGFEIVNNFGDAAGLFVDSLWRV